MALLSVPSRRMSVSQIYDFITTRFPYFKTAKPGWKNSVRHNLSLNKYFCKLERRDDEAGKGSMWGISPGMEASLERDVNQSVHRRQHPKNGILAASAAGSPARPTLQARAQSSPVITGGLPAATSAAPPVCRRLSAPALPTQTMMSLPPQVISPTAMHFSFMPPFEPSPIPEGLDSFLPEDLAAQFSSLDQDDFFATCSTASSTSSDTPLFGWTPEQVC